MGSSRNPINSMAAIKKGSKGDSAYIIASKHGFNGTEEEWLSSLQGDTGSVTKEGVEAVLTGEITSHTHPHDSTKADINLVIALAVAL